MMRGMIGQRRTKHGNKRIVVEGIKFDSQREYHRWCQLRQMERVGLIDKLEHQVKYTLIPPVMLDGKTKPAIRYIADFVYFDNKLGRMIVEDAKSPHLKVNKVYRMKKHMMKHFHGIDIIEV